MAAELVAQCDTSRRQLETLHLLVKHEAEKLTELEARASDVANDWDVLSAAQLLSRAAPSASLTVADQGVIRDVLSIFHSQNSDPGLLPYTKLLCGLPRSVYFVDLTATPDDAAVATAQAFELSGEQKWEQVLSFDETVRVIQEQARVLELLEEHERAAYRTFDNLLEDTAPPVVDGGSRLVAPIPPPLRHSNVSANVAALTEVDSTPPLPAVSASARLLPPNEVAALNRRQSARRESSWLGTAATLAELRSRCVEEDKHQTQALGRRSRDDEQRLVRLLELAEEALVEVRDSVGLRTVTSAAPRRSRSVPGTTLRRASVARASILNAGAAVAEEEAESVRRELTETQRALERAKIESVAATKFVRSANEALSEIEQLRQSDAEALQAKDAEISQLRAALSRKREESEPVGKPGSGVRAQSGSPRTARSGSLSKDATSSRRTSQAKDRKSTLR